MNVEAVTERLAPIPLVDGDCWTAKPTGRWRRAETRRGPGATTVPALARSLRAK
jgi:hypothetical protein